ncbi:T9SS type A sorting domain-containing protein [Taibaiella koreensis]|uniref:T9SS type A sorting domain-containing protein n=1 Tax=Taibaiella koreensis TaxID=1268548 RepID=UPI000E59A276|nr:T9SS type A sorting domain-containing protein [Taibaiella koreensis]
MKQLLCSLILLLGAFSAAMAAWTNHSLSSGGQVRVYRTYVPPGYDPGRPASLIVVLHGLGGTMYDADNVGITQIADTANIILISPQALDFNSPLGIVAGAWNSGIVVNVPGLGAVPVNGTVDDVGFIKAMMDTTQGSYRIDPARVYVCGASMGGFMTQRLACEAAGYFAAAASVMGTYALALPPCNPGKMIPIAHFHGTRDEVVSWNGDLLFGGSAFPVGLSVDALIARWVTLDGCNTTPLHEVWPDSNNDTLYAEHYSYSDAAGQSRVELFKVNKGTHAWYTSANTNGDIDYASEIWKFFNKQYRSGATGVDDLFRKQFSVSLYPNPAQETLHIDAAGQFNNVQISDLYGRTVAAYTKPDIKAIDISGLRPGIYCIRLQAAQGALGFAKFVKQ